MVHQGSFRAGVATAVAALVCGGVVTADAQSIDVDRKLGAQAVAEVESTYGIVAHERAAEWVEAVGERLVAGLGPQPFEYSFRLVNMTEPNAFALPAGHVFVAPSLLAVARSEDELAGLAAGFVKRLQQEYRTAPASAGEVSAEGRTAHMVTLEEATKRGVVSLNVLWLKLGEQTFQVLAAGEEKHRAAMRASLLSLRALSGQERRSVTAVYLRGATARAGETLESLGEREGNVLRLDLLALMNGLAADAALAEGLAIRIGKREPYRSR